MKTWAEKLQQSAGVILSELIPMVMNLTLTFGSAKPTEER